MEQDACRGFLDEQATKDERAGGEAEVRAGRVSLQAHAFNGFQPTEFRKRPMNPSFHARLAGRILVS